MEMKNQQEKKPPKLDQGYSLLAAKQNTSFYFEIVRFSIQRSVRWHLWCIFFSLIFVVFVYIPSSAFQSEWIKGKKCCRQCHTMKFKKIFHPTIAQSHRGFCNITDYSQNMHGAQIGLKPVHRVSIIFFLAAWNATFSMCEWRWFFWATKQIASRRVAVIFHHSFHCFSCVSIEILSLWHSSQNMRSSLH